MKYASPSKLWIAVGGKILVPDGDARAVGLFSRAGQEIQESELEKFTNGREAFGLVRTAVESAPLPPAEDEKQESEESPAEAIEEEKPKRGRPRK